MIYTYTVIKIQFEKVYSSFSRIQSIENSLYLAFLEEFIKQRGTEFIGVSYYRASTVVKNDFK